LLFRDLLGEREVDRFDVLLFLPPADFFLFGDADFFCGGLLFFRPSPLLFLLGDRDRFCGELFLRPSDFVDLLGDRV
jgi:hypothetical protein